MSRSPTPSPPAASELARRQRAATGAAVALLLLPVLVVLGLNALGAFDPATSNGKPAPQWVTPGEVRATTRDGTVVKVRVAFDADGASNKSEVENRLYQIGLVLETSVGAQQRDGITGAGGIERLAADMLQRVNSYLEAEGVAPIHSVAIQELWYTKR